MLEIKGDFWKEAPRFDALICTTNGIIKQNNELVMGAGIAKEFAIRYPILPKVFGKNTKQGGNHSSIHIENSKVLLSMPTKYNWWDKSTLTLIERSAKEIVKLLPSNIKGVLSPRPGCGLGGLHWEKEVQQMLNNIWDDRFVVISK